MAEHNFPTKSFLLVVQVSFQLERIFRAALCGSKRTKGASLLCISVIWFCPVMSSTQFKLSKQEAVMDSLGQKALVHISSSDRLAASPFYLTR